MPYLPMRPATEWQKTEPTQPIRILVKIRSRPQLRRPLWLRNVARDWARTRRKIGHHAVSCALSTGGLHAIATSIAFRSRLHDGAGIGFSAGAVVATTVTATVARGVVLAPSFALAVRDRGPGSAAVVVRKVVSLVTIQCTGRRVAQAFDLADITT
jgi:hypothetical protein